MESSFVEPLCDFVFQLKMNDGLHPAREGFHPFQLLFLNEQTAFPSSELQPYPVQSHGYVSIATVSNWVHMRKLWEQREHERERENKVSPSMSEPGWGFDWHHMGRPDRELVVFYVALQRPNVPMTTASLSAMCFCSLCPSLNHKQ